MSFDITAKCTHNGKHSCADNVMQRRMIILRILLPDSLGQSVIVENTQDVARMTVVRLAEIAEIMLAGVIVRIIDINEPHYKTRGDNSAAHQRICELASALHIKSI